jgi:hypothetical protein
MKRLIAASLLVALSSFAQAAFDTNIGSGTGDHRGWLPAARNNVIVEFLDVPATAGKTALPTYRATLVRFRADLASVSPKAEVRREYFRVFHGVSVRVARGDLAAIAKLPYVKRIHDDHEMHAFAGPATPRSSPPAVSQIGADKVWTTYGTRGQGVVVAVVDTGIDYTHEALGKGFGPGFKVAGGYDIANDDPDPMDDSGHGTHVAGIIAGESSTITGVAPDVTLLAFKVLDANGSGSESDVIAGIERAADPNSDGDTSDHADVVNISLGGFGNPDDPISEAVDNGTRLGIVFAIAAGNSGAVHAIASPGTARSAITVGAVDSGDVVAKFSSLGPSPSDLIMKPDVAAPGVNINSSIPGGNYYVASGTSMATPHVAGAAALLKAIHRDWTPAQIKAALILTGQQQAQEAMFVGGGRIDVAAAAAFTLAVDAPTINFGLDPIGGTKWAPSRTIHVTNRSDKPATWTVSTTASPTFGVTVTPPSLTLDPGASGELTLAMNIDNAKVAVGPSSFSGDGVITLTSPTSTARVPFTFVKAVRATLRWEKQWVDVLWLDSTRTIFAPSAYLDSNVAEVLIFQPEDYDVIVYGTTLDDQTGAWTRATFLYFEKMHLDGDMTINATEAQATHVIRGAKVTADGKPVLATSDQAYAMTGRVTIPQGTAPGGREIAIPAVEPHALYVNDLAEGFGVFLNEAYVDFADHAIYSIQHPKLNGFKADVNFTMDNTKSVPVELLIPTSPRDDRRVEVRFTPRPAPNSLNGGLTFVTSAKITESEWKGRVFLTPDVDPLNATYVSFAPSTDVPVPYDDPFLQPVAEGQSAYETPFLHILNGQIEIVPFADSSLSTLPRFDTGAILFGAGPRLPLLRFFTSGPLFPPTMLALFLGSHGETLATDQKKTHVVGFAENGTQVADFHFNPAQLKVITPGRYTFEITDQWVQYPDLPQKLDVTLHVDSTQSDFLPPTLTSMYLVDSAGNAVRNARPHAATTLYFSAGDYSVVPGNGTQPYQQIRPEATALWYRYAGASAWTQLPATQVTENPPNGTIYRADLTSVANVDWARVDLKIDITDNAGNTTSTVMQPAFSVGSEYPPRRHSAK